MRRLLSLVLVSLVLVAASGMAACSVLGDPTTLNLSALATRSHAGVGDSITFSVNVTGVSVTSIQIAFGDGAADQFTSSGNRSLGKEFKHAYAKIGRYVASVSAHDANAGDKSADIEIFIDPPASP